MQRFIVGTLFFLSLVAAPSNLLAQPGLGLHIVVIGGESAVNIIQQKTAVAPLIEVRDRNNLPVSGAVVTFAVEGGKAAAFAGGAPSFTIATNAAGQAAATGFSPLVSGAVQINVSAVAQGQTIIATITQTNVMTAAQAAAAAGGTSAGGAASGASGAAAGGSGGISAMTIGIVGAAVGGGAIAATQLAGNDAPSGTREYAGQYSGQMTLLFFTNAQLTATCARVHALTGTVTIEMNPHASAVSGTGHVAATSTVVSSACQGGGQAGAVDHPGMPDTPLVSRANGVGFDYQELTTTPGTAGTFATNNTLTYSFTGEIKDGGNTITGVLTYTQKIESPGSGFPATTGSATFQVTLTPK